MTGRALLFPALFALGVGALAVATAVGVDVALAAPTVVVVHVVVVALAERRWPRVEGIDLFADPQSPRDAAHGLLTSLVGSPVGAVAATSLLAAAIPGGELTWWPTEIAMPIQIVCAWLIYGFADYWKHRAYHSIDALWWLHAVHHDTPHMHVLKGARLHLLEGTARAGLVALPLLVLGVPAPVLIWATTIDSFLGNLNHSNLDQHLPTWAHRIVPTIDLHHIHHALDRELHDTNLGIPIFDLTFGTYTDPRVAPRPVMGTSTPIPHTLKGQLAFPLEKWIDSTLTRR